MPAAMSDRAYAVSAATVSTTMPGAMSANYAVSAAAVSAAMSANAFTVSAASMPAASMPAASMAAATPAGVCFECEKRYYEEQHSGRASAGRQHRPCSVAGLGAPHPRGRLSLGTLPRTKSF